jgi:opacity protein-like surface antigen
MTRAPRRQTCRSFGRVALLLAAALLLFALPVQADDKDDDEGFGNTGPYIGFSGVYTHNFFDAQVDDALEQFLGEKVDVAIDDSWGLNARLGYRLTSWFAIEAQYEYIDDFDVKARVPSGQINNIPVPGIDKNQKLFTVEGHTLTGNMRFIAPLWRTQPYVLLGAGYSLYESDVTQVGRLLINDGGGKQSGFAGRAGGGIDLYITKNIIANSEVSVLFTTQDFSNRDTGNIDDLWYVSIGAGLKYQF